MKTYKDFDLLIEKVGERYRARVQSSPDGTGSSDFDLPFTDLELETSVLHFSQNRRNMRHIGVAGEVTSRSPSEFGSRLYDAIFSGEVSYKFRSSLAAVRQTANAGLRIRLFLDAPELIDIPWEYLFDASNERFLALSVDTPVVRSLGKVSVEPLAVHPPLKILAMISSPIDYAELDAEQEWQKLKDAVADLENAGLVVLERMEKPTLAELQRRLHTQDIHIFHFIGHGGFDEAAQDGVLILETEDGKAKPTSGKDMGTLLHDEKTIRLVVLNACEGGRTSRQDPFAGVGQSLVLQGIPAVVAMQFEISDQAAIVLAHQLYAALAGGYPVDAALAEARRAIFAEDNASVEWGTPVLYMDAGDGRVFELPGISSTQGNGQPASTSVLTQPPQTHAFAETPVSAKPLAVNGYRIAPVNVLQGRVLVVRPLLDAEQAAQAIVKWGEKWVQEWPADTTAASLGDKLSLVYVPFLVVNGTATANVTASLGKIKVFRELSASERVKECFFCEGSGASSSGGECIHCSGKGYQGDAVYAWNEHTSVARVSIEDSVLANCGGALLNLNIQGRTVKGVELSSPYPEDVVIFEPETASGEGFRSRARRCLQDKLQAETKKIEQSIGAEAVRDIRVSEMSVQELDTYSWLLPVFVGVFGTISILVDGVTGAISSDRVESPQSQGVVRTTIEAAVAQAHEKQEEHNKSITFWFGLLVLVVFLLFVGFMLLSSLR